MPFRLDIGSLRKPKRLADGRLRVDGHLTRAGVFSYRNPDGSERIEYRPPEEVFRRDSLDSFAFVPITNDHPDEMLTTATARKHAIGTTGENIRQDGQLVAASMIIFDEDAIEKMDAGKTELSCGYEVDLEMRSGVTPQGDRYDAIQRNIRGNHVALVDVGRAGPEARVRMDAAVMMPVPSNTKQGEPMEELQKQLAAALAAQAKAEVRADAAEAERDKIQVEKDVATARADAAEGERDAAKTALEDEKKARADAAEGEPAKIRARIELENKSAPILGTADAPFEPDGKTDRDIKSAVVAKIDGIEAAALSEKSDDYVSARYDMAIDRVEKSEGAMNDLRVIAGSGNLRGDEDKESAAHKAMIERRKAAFRSDVDEKAS